MQFLPVAAALDGFHKYVFSHHERQLFAQILFDYTRINNQAICYVCKQFKHCVDGEKRLRQCDAAYGRIVERTLEKLCALGHRRILHERRDVAGE
ncbi:hypothetical protein SDC9_186230 [bioreactor metagenome]|uniref:Uncharacterized protein n=1 Tax=bioreactor metagenome TaxID=1076179 RepID=A0A645HI66_9ZZZZ